MLRFVLCAALWALAGTVDAATILLVRHAERDAAPHGAGMSTDTPLSGKGLQRAEALARLLAEARIESIYVTDTKRTQQTAAALAGELHLTPVILPGSDMDGLVGRLRKLRPDEVVLVVGHSNTVPQIVTALGGTTPPLAESEFDRLLIVSTGSGDTPTVLTLRYGD